MIVFASLAVIVFGPFAIAILCALAAAGRADRRAEEAVKSISAPKQSPEVSRAVLGILMRRLRREGRVGR